MLTVEFQTVEIPLAHETVHQSQRVALRGGIDRREVVTVPPGDVFGRPFGRLQQHLGVFAQDARAGIGRHRRPPQLGLHAQRVNGIGHTAHVAAASRKTGVRLPIALGDLVAVVHVHPPEAQFGHFGQRSDHLADGELPFVSPSAPDRLEGPGFGSGHADAAVALHVGRKAAQRIEEIALLHGHEAVVSRQRVAPGEEQFLVESAHEGHRRRVAAAAPDDGHGDRTQTGFGQSDAHAAVAPPERNHRNAAAVIRVVHAEVVLLPESRTHRKHPVRPGRGGGGLERPQQRVGPDAQSFATRRRTCRSPPRLI